MSLLADIAAAAAAGQHSNPAPDSADGRFTASGAIIFVQQADALGQGDLARSLVARNESDEISSSDARKAVMEAAHAARGSGAVGGSPSSSIDGGAIYAARSASVQAATDIRAGEVFRSGGVFAQPRDAAPEIDHAEIYSSRRRATEASARALHREL